MPAPGRLRPTIRRNSTRRWRILAGRLAPAILVLGAACAQEARTPVEVRYELSAVPIEGGFLDYRLREVDGGTVAEGPVPIRIPEPGEPAPLLLDRSLPPGAYVLHVVMRSCDEGGCDDPDDAAPGPEIRCRPELDVGDDAARFVVSVDAGECTARPVG